MMADSVELSVDEWQKESGFVGEEIVRILNGGYIYV